MVLSPCYIGEDQ